MSKFDRFMDKAAIFFWKHKFGFALGGSILVGYFAGRSYQKEQNKKQAESIKEEQERQKRIAEYEEKRKEHDEDPKNQLGDCGIVDWYEVYSDEDGNAEAMAFNAYDVPIEKLGELGEELLKWTKRDDLDEDPNDIRDVIQPGSTCYVTLGINKPEKDELDKAIDAIKEAVENDPAIEVVEF